MKKKEFDADFVALGMFGICLAVLATYAMSQGAPNSDRRLAQADEPSQQDCAPYGIDAPYPDFPIEKAPKEIVMNYRQDGLKLVDPAADFALGVIAQDMPRNVGRMIRRDHEAQETHRRRLREAERCAIWYFGLDPNPYLSTYGEPRGSLWPEDESFVADLEVSAEEKQELRRLIGQGEIQVEDKRRPISVKGLVRAYLTVIRQEHEATGLEPRLGDQHAWSREFKKSHGRKFLPYSLVSKPFMALWRGVSGRVMATGQERALEEWIVAQPDSSITLPEMFRRSYRLNQGDVYLTLLTIENLLAKDWQTPNRKSLVKTRKLSRIVHAVGAMDDRFGTWYHLFGVTYYGYVRSGIQSWMVGEAEALGSLLIDRFDPEFQENSINRSGGFVGARLRRAIKKGTWRDAKEDDALDADQYLTSDAELEQAVLKALRGKKKSAAAEN